METPVRLAVIGAGQRGRLFGDIISRLPQWGHVSAVAEPRREYREAFAARHGLSGRSVAADWRELAGGRREFDAAVICTQDRDHVEPAVAFLGMGCHLFLEKPMASTLEDCVRIAEAERRAGTITCVCHSLRYHAGFAALKSLVASGRIGRVASIDQLEQVAWWHQAHSFVRGAWANEARSGFMLLTKSCHDIDFIAHLAGADCRRVHSFGSLAWFRREHAPAESAERCTECRIEKRCPYSAIRQYVDADREAWPARVVSLDHSRESHLQAVTEGPYGRCVWKCDNDVVDHQVVSMEFDDGATATFTMTAFTAGEGRRIRVHGTEGDVQFAEDHMSVRTFADGNTDEVVFERESGGHGGGDERTMATFLAAIRANDPTLVRSDVRESLRTHAIVFAAERSRRQGRAVDMEEMGVVP